MVSDPAYAAIGVVVVNLGVFVFGLILHRWRPWRDNMGKVGVHFTLLPTALFAWLSNPWLWLATAFSIIGIIFMRAMEAPGVAQPSGSGHGLHGV